MRKGLVRGVLFVAATLVATIQPAFAADAIDQTLGNITGWAQGLLISLGVLGFVLGGAFFIFDHTIGGQERILALARDITEKKRSAEELSRQREAQPSFGRPYVGIRRHDKPF